MRKYLFYFDSNAYGGSEKFLFELITHLRTANEVRLICAHPEVARANPAFKDIPLIEHRVRNIFDIGAIFRLRGIIKDYSPDLMFFNLHVPFSCQYAILAAAGTLNRSKMAAAVHYTQKMISKFPLVGNIRMIVSGYLLNKLGRIICVSNAAKIMLFNNYHLHNDRIMVRSLGSKMPENAGKTVTPLRKDGLKVVGAVSRLVREKGLEVLIDAFSDVLRTRGDVVLTILGGGYLENELKAKVKALSISDNVVFAGYVSDPLPLISTFNVFVLPSFFETFSYALLEAMSLSRPIVATRVGGIPEILDDQSGILVPPRDKKALTNAIIKLLEDEKLAAKYGQNAFNVFKGKYRKEESLDRLAKTLSEIAGEKVYQTYENI